jgi:hypothetical protein
MAFVTFHSDKPYKGHRGMSLSREKALDLQRVLKHPETATAAQKSFIPHVKAVYIPSINERILKAKEPIQTHWSETDLTKGD